MLSSTVGALNIQMPGSVRPCGSRTHAAWLRTHHKVNKLETPHPYLPPIGHRGTQSDAISRRRCTGGLCAAGGARALRHSITCTWSYLYRMAGQVHTASSIRVPHPGFCAAVCAAACSYVSLRQRVQGGAWLGRWVDSLEHTGANSGHGVELQFSVRGRVCARHQGGGSDAWTPDRDPARVCFHAAPPSSRSASESRANMFDKTRSSAAYPNRGASEIKKHLQQRGNSIL